MLSVDDLRLLGDRVLVDPDDRLTITEGGLHIPETVYRDNPNYFGMSGVVVKLGAGVATDWYQCVTCGQETQRDRGECPRCRLQLAGTNIRLSEHGDGRRRFAVAVGDRVVFNRFAGRQVEVAGKRHLIMREDEILGISDGDGRILPVYEDPRFGKVTDGTRQGILTPVA